MWLDASASHAQPPANTIGDATVYGLLGARLLADLGGFDLDLAGRGGQALGGDLGQWIQGDVVLHTGRPVGSAALSFTIAGFGLDYSEPFDYRAGGGDLRPEIAVPVGTTVWVLAPRWTAGSWSADSLQGDLRVAGGGLEIQRALGSVDAAARVDVLDVDNGVTAGLFVTGGASASRTRGRWTVAGELRLQDTPLETELGGLVSLTGLLSPDLALRLEAGRFLRDPLFGTPGAVGLSAVVSVRPVRVRPPAALPVVSTGKRRDGGREVRFALGAPDAERVELSGDFTGWEPVPMERRRGGWRLTLTLPPGLHHFGFLVDGAWAVPPGAPGLVDDGWGRLNASVVIEP